MQQQQDGGVVNLPAIAALAWVTSWFRRIAQRTTASPANAAACSAVRPFLSATTCPSPHQERAKNKKRVKRHKRERGADLQASPSLDQQREARAVPAGSRRRRHRCLSISVLQGPSRCERPHCHFVSRCAAIVTAVVQDGHQQAQHARCTAPFLTRCTSSNDAIVPAVLSALAQPRLGCRPHRA